MPLSETAMESKSNAERSNRTETTLLLSEDDELEAQTDHVYEVSPRITEACLDDPREPTYHAATKNPPSASCAPPGGPSLGGSAPPTASQQGGDGGTDPLKENTKVNAVGRVKPRPPDPSTKPPRASWIHQSKSPKQKIHADDVQRGTKSSERTTGTVSVPSAVTPSVEELETPEELGASTRSPSGFLPLEPISRAVQSVWRQIRHTDSHPAASKTLSGKHPDGAESNCDVVAPRRMAPQPQNTVLKRNDLESRKEIGRPSARNKKKELSQAGSREGTRSSPVLTTSVPPNGDLLPSKADSPGKEGLRNVQKGSPAHPKKPVQIKNPQEGNIYSKINANE